eukprot:244922-Alexandrium_andersonii.AAC.1
MKQYLGAERQVMSTNKRADIHLGRLNPTKHEHRPVPCKDAVVSKRLMPNRHADCFRPAPSI